MFNEKKVSKITVLISVLMALSFTGCASLKFEKPPVQMPEAKSSKEAIIHPSEPPLKSLPPAPAPPVESVPETKAIPPAVQEPAPEPVAPSSPRELAALNLIDKGKALIDAQKPDEAIRVLERAIEIQSGQGKGYYFLAEAWMMKGNRGQAAEFNRLAGVYLRNSPAWSGLVEAQRRRIESR
jgi:hypothetical protein